MRHAAVPATGDVDRPASGLQARCYTDPEILRLERERLFWPGWQWVGHVSDLPAPGTALRCDLPGRSALVLRGRDGLLRAFHNVCPHRGSRLIDGDRSTGLAFCVDGRVRCPNHAWVYDDTGELLHVPREEQYPELDRAQLGLRPLFVETWLGQVFIAFERPLQPVAAALGACAGDLDPYRLEAMRRIGEPRMRTRAANWKVICEQRLDLQHVATERAAPGPADGRGVRFQARADVPCISGDVCADDAASWSARAYGRWLPDLPALPLAQRRTWTRFLLWPATIFDAHPDQVRVTRLMPIGVGETQLRETAYGLPDASRGMRLARYLNERIHRRAGTVERRVVERVHSGLASGDHAAGPLAADEPGLRWFTHRWRCAMPGYDDVTPARRDARPVRPSSRRPPPAARRPR